MTPFEVESPKLAFISTQYSEINYLLFWIKKILHALPLIAPDLVTCKSNVQHCRDNPLGPSQGSVHLLLTDAAFLWHEAEIIQEEINKQKLFDKHRMSLMEVVKGHEKVERELEKLESTTMPDLLAEPAGNFSELDVPNSRIILTQINVWKLILAYSLLKINPGLKTSKVWKG